MASDDPCPGEARCVWVNFATGRKCQKPADHDGVHVYELEEEKRSLLVDAWRTETTGVAKRIVRHAWIYDEEYAASLAIAAVQAGADEGEMVRLIEELKSSPSSGGES
jgi:hypothetical protein